jgi:hypothetical protein
MKKGRCDELNPKSWTPTFGVFSWPSTARSSSSPLSKTIYRTHLKAIVRLEDGTARSTFYYQQGLLRQEDKYGKLKETIKAVFERHKGRYGYRRVTAAVRQSGSSVNHKLAQGQLP